MSQGSVTKPRPGQHVRFIRYVSTRDGWTHEILRGEFEEQIDTGWRIRVVDEIRDLPDSEWSFYRE